MTALMEKYRVLTGKEEKKEEKKKTPSKYPISVGRVIAEPDTGITFEVAETDVTGSVVKDPEHCAGANALCRLPDVEHAWVFKTRTLIKRSSGIIERYQNPAGLEKAVSGFDSLAGLFPAGEYKLVPLSPGDRKAARDKWNAAHKKRNGGKRPYATGKVTPMKKIGR